MRIEGHHHISQTILYSSFPYIGFAILCEDWRHFCLINPVQHLMGRPNDGEVLIDVSNEDFHTETFIDKPYAKAYYKKLNEEFQKGLIEQDTFTDSYDAYIAKISSGRVLCYLKFHGLFLAFG